MFKNYFENNFRIFNLYMYMYVCTIYNSIEKKNLNNKSCTVFPM